MPVAVSHLYTSLEHMIVPMQPDFVWIFANDSHIVHNGLLPNMEVPIHRHQHCHDTHVSGKVIQAVQTPTNDLRMQTRSLAEWDPTGKMCLHVCSIIFPVGSHPAKLLVCMRSSIVSVCTACITSPDMQTHQLCMFAVLSSPSAPTLPNFLSACRQDIVATAPQQARSGFSVPGFAVWPACCLVIS